MVMEIQMPLESHKQAECLIYRAFSGSKKLSHKYKFQGIGKLSLRPASPALRRTSMDKQGGHQVQPLLSITVISVLANFIKFQPNTIIY